MTTKNGNEVYIQERTDTYNGLMGVGVFPYTVEQVLVHIQKPDSMLDANTFLEKMDIIEQLSNSKIVNLCQFKLIYVCFR